MTQREWFIFLVRSFEGMPYQYAGGHKSIPDPWAKGPDCSGMGRWALIHKRVGLYPPDWDCTSQTMFDEFPPIEYPFPGTCVFWKDPHSQKIKHVEYAIEERGRQIMCIGARASRNLVIKLPLDEQLFPRCKLKLAGYRDPFQIKNQVWVRRA
jgi:hypothetical protein